MLEVGDILVTTVDLVFKSITSSGENVVDTIVQVILQVDFRVAIVGRVREGGGGKLKQSGGRGADGMG